MPPQTRMLSVRNWKKFQHYKQRNPPWVKLHFEIFASMDWVGVNDASRLLIPILLLIASRHDGCVPDNPDYIKRVAYLNKRPNLKPLIECGFLSETQADASVLQADARPETETETEQRKKESRRRAPAKRGMRLPEGWVPSDENIAFAKKEGRTFDDTLDIGARFRDYWIAQPGSKGVKLDWDATWRNWIRREGTNGYGGKSLSQRREPDSALENAVEWAVRNTGFNDI